MLEAERADLNETGPTGPASVEQQALAVLHDVHGERSQPSILLEIAGALEIRRLEQAWRAVVARHDALRTSFANGAGTLQRTRHPASDADALELEVIEASVAESRSQALAALANARLEAARWPPCHAVLVRSQPNRHLLGLTFHSLVADDHSLELAARDLLAYYAALVTGEPVDLPVVADDYGEFVSWEQASIAERAAEARAYWEPKLPLVADAARIPASPSSEGQRSPDWRFVTFGLDVALKEQLERLAGRERASLFSCLLATLQVLQHRYAGGGPDGVATAVTVDPRARRFSDVIGMLSYELPLVSAPADAMPFREFLATVHARAGELFALSGFPFTEALARFGRPTGGSDAAGQVRMTYRRTRGLAAPAGLELVSHEVVAPAGSPRPLSVAFLDEPGALAARLDFDARSFAPELARRIAQHLQALLRSVAASPHAPIGRLAMLSPDERRKALIQWSGAGSSADALPGPDATVARLVQRQVAASGAAAAIEASGTQLTYAALDVAANRLAHRLRDLGVGPDITVGVCLPRSPELVIGLLAILKAGGAYVPLDPAYPLDRLQVMMEQARPRVLMSHGELVDGLPQTRGKVLLLDRDAAAIAQESEADPEPLAQGADLAYVIFTSGSTGRPKGVAMPHQGLCNLLEWQARGFGGDRPRRTLQFASPSFDVGFQDIFSTLATGGTLVVVPDELRRDFDRLASFIDDERIERLFLPPLALRELAVRLAGAPATTPDVEIIAAGEQLEITPAIRELFTSRPGWTLHNQYGPTESHVVTSHSLAGDPSGWPDLPPIGRPIPNARVYLLDGGGEPVPAGVPGELFIGGVSVARGYLNQPRLTAERFLPDPFAGGDARMYRTGDLARWGDDGTIEFLGRVDDQVKIRGFRVEPAEVVTALLRHPEVAHAAVVAEEHTPPLRRLVAYVVPASQPAPGPRELRDFLAASLPDYMVPAAFLTLDTLPMTPNGKLDRRALPPSDVSPEPVQAPAPPASETEARVAAIWAEILGFERVGLDDNFFELGGHSLLAGDVVSRCSRALGVSLAMRILFAGPTVREMSTAIEEARRRGDVETAIPRARRRRVSDVAGDA